jgi:hypothetical protein
MKENAATTASDHDLRELTDEDVQAITGGIAYYVPMSMDGTTLTDTTISGAAPGAMVNERSALTTDYERQGQSRIPPYLLR